MINLLNQLSAAEVAITIYSPKSSSYSYGGMWEVSLRKSDNGTQLSIDVQNESLEAAVEEGFNKWLRATGRGIPSLSLKQIEHQEGGYEYPPLNR